MFDRKWKAKAIVNDLIDQKIADKSLRIDLFDFVLNIVSKLQQKEKKLKNTDVRFYTPLHRMVVPKMNGFIVNIPDPTNRDGRLSMSIVQDEMGAIVYYRLPSDSGYDLVKKKSRKGANYTSINVLRHGFIRYQRLWNTIISNKLQGKSSA